MSCQKEETTVKDGYVCRGAYSLTSGKVDVLLLLLLRATSRYFTPGVGGQIG